MQGEERKSDPGWEVGKIDEGFFSSSQVILGKETAGMKMESKVSWDIYEFSRWNTDLLPEFKLDSTGTWRKSIKRQ